MLCTYLRSSGFNTYSMCEQQYFINYVLGWKMPSGKKAEKGTIVHKALECIAVAQKARQDEIDVVEDPEIGTVRVKGIDSDKFVNEMVARSYKYYTEASIASEPLWLQKAPWKPRDDKDCHKWTWEALNYHGGIFDPRELKIITPEEHFDFEIEADWAKYFFVGPDGNVMQGQWSIKGTIDLVVEARPGVLEAIDWKTGRRLDWATGEEKTYKKLCTDPQLRLYHYALSKIYPDIDQIIMTIYFINDGGPYTMAYTKKDIADTEEMLRKRFETIRDNTRPSLITNPYHRWKCSKICHYGKTQHPKDPSKTICQYIKDKTRKCGIDSVVKTETVPGHDVGYYEAPGSTS